MQTITILLIFMLGIIASASIFYEIDAGLKASHYCIEHGETAECFIHMERAK